MDVALLVWNLPQWHHDRFYQFLWGYQEINVHIHVSTVSALPVVMVLSEKVCC